MNKYNRRRCAAILIAGLFVSLHPLFAQLTPAEAGYLDAVGDFGADNTGMVVTTAELQAAINAATSEHKPLFIPPGTYLVDGTLIVSDDAGGERELQNTFITGSSIDPENRTVLYLKEGTFSADDAIGHVIRHEGFGDEKYPDTFDRILQSIDIVIGNNNANAIGLRWRGAEGCAIFDVNIDVTGGLYGMEMLPGSGGSAADISVTGGKTGIFLGSNMVQPTPTITCLTMKGQTERAIYSDHTRGALTIIGARFIMNTGVPVFDLVRHTGLTWSPGGNPVLTDCVIQYDTINALNRVMTMADGGDQSVHFSNVYVKNAAEILDEDVSVPANENGWRHYKEFSYNSGWDKNPNGDEPIYLDGVRQADKTYTRFEDGIEPPPDIQSRHGWGDTFPAFHSPGAINIMDYEGMKNGGDWAPAFNAAITDAQSSGSNIVFVPVGYYTIYNTIHLGEHTALIGAGHQNSIILGKDISSYRFGGSKGGWTDPKPMITTPDSQTADCILADLAVRPNTPYNNESHTPVALACYSVLWRAGNYSIIRNIDYHQYSTNNYRAAFVLTNNLTSSSWLSLRNINSPSDIGGYTFTSDCAHAYHTSFTVGSRILVENVDGDKRLMTRSLPPARMNAVETFHETPNLKIQKSSGEPFNVDSLRISNASWDPADATDVFIRGYGDPLKDTIIHLRSSSRKIEHLIRLSWTGMDSLVITSEIQFSIDDLGVDGTLLNFNELSGETITPGEDMDHLCSGYGFMDLPMYVMAHPYVTISGGCKYYNHWIHGSTWMRVTEPYLEVEGNEPDDIVSIYHTHAQHSENFYKIRINKAHNVSLFGIKTENSLEFAHVDSSDNIRVFGHGGMTNPPRGVAHYRIENSTNTKIVSPSDEVSTSVDECRSCALGDVMLPITTFGYYDDIQLLSEGVVYKPTPTDSPILFKWGNPYDPWTSTCTIKYEVTVENGYGSNSFCQGNRVTIRPEMQDCGTFIKWTGDNIFLDDSTSSVAVIDSMPARDLHFKPVYSSVSAYNLEVIQGSGSGKYCDQTEMVIVADPAEEGMMFDHWTGDVDFLEDSLRKETVVLVAGQDISVEAVYREYVRPYHGSAIEIPGTVESEYFDYGGEGIAYHDADPNIWDVFRVGEDVDVNLVVLDDSVFYVGNTEAGEWVEYTIKSTREKYELAVVYGTGTSGCKLYFEVDGEKVTETLTLGLSGGWESFDTLKYEPVIIGPGEHLLRMVVEWGKFNVQGFIFSPYYEQNLTIGTDGMGTVVPDGGVFKRGTVVELTAQPDDGYLFSEWTGDLVSTDNPVEITMDKDKSVTAHFVESDPDAVGLYSPESIRIYPNPFSYGELIIETPAESVIVITDLTGRPMLNISGNREYTVSHDYLRSGMYLVSIRMADGRVQLPLIVN